MVIHDIEIVNNHVYRSYLHILFIISLIVIKLINFKIRFSNSRKEQRLIWKRKRDFQFPSHYLNFNHQQIGESLLGDPTIRRAHTRNFESRWSRLRQIHPPIISLMTKWGGGGEEERDGKQEGENSAVASRYFRRITTIWSYAWKRLLSPSLPLFLPLRVYQYPVITDSRF